LIATTYLAIGKTSRKLEVAGGRRFFNADKRTTDNGGCLAGDLNIHAGRPIAQKLLGKSSFPGTREIITSFI